MRLEWLDSLGKGFGVTFHFFIITLLFSLPLGLMLAITHRILPKWAKKLIEAYVYLFRGTPLLLQLMFIFFGLPKINITLGRFESAYLTLILNYTAYYIEIFRGGIQAIPSGQFEALKVLSIKPLVGWRKVILPQVFRIVMPSVGNEVITLIKDTSLIHILGLTDLLKVGKTLANQHVTLMPYVYVGIIYLVFTGITSYLLKKIEARIEG